MSRNKRRVTPQQKGFTIMQMIVTIAIIAVVTCFGVLGITTARAEFRLQNSARLFASYVEKARADSIRRHVDSGDESYVETFGPGTSTYAIRMDFGSGVETRTFPLESGLSFATVAKKVTFDWRGRIASAWVFQVFSLTLEKSLPVDVSGSGDITVGEQHFPDQLIPAVEISQVTGDTINSTPTPTPTPQGPTPTPTPTPVPTPTPTPPNGNGNGGTGDNSGNGGTNGGTNNGNGNGNATPTPTPIPTPTPTPSAGGTPIPQCYITVSPVKLELSQSDPAKTSGTATFTLTNATGVRLLSAATEGNGNSLVLGLSLARIDGSGSTVLTVTTKNGAGNRGTFSVDLVSVPACGTTPKLEVEVKN